MKTKMKTIGKEILIWMAAFIVGAINVHVVARLGFSTSSELLAHIVIALCYSIPVCGITVPRYTRRIKREQEEAFWKRFQ